MKLFLDSADPDVIRHYTPLGVVDGVTTNPSLIAKSKRELKPTIMEICEIVDGPVSVEVVHEDVDGMLKDAYEYVSWHRNVYVKLPMTRNGLITLRELHGKGIRTNVTLVFSAGQALLAAKAGATLISPFVGRLDDAGENGMAIVADMITIMRTNQLDSKILVASIRTTDHVIQAAKLGADIATLPPAILEELLVHPLTDAGHKQFLDDWKKHQEK